MPFAQAFSQSGELAVRWKVHTPLSRCAEPAGMDAYLGRYVTSCCYENRLRSGRSDPQLFCMCKD